MRPNVSDVQRAVSYDQLSGAVTWKNDRTRSVKAGALAGWDNGNDYRRVEIKGKRVYAHHIAWLYLYGGWPNGEIDHINGNPLDNRKCNLRLADRFENNRNSRKRSHSACGVKGVRLDRTGKKFVARITVNKKCSHIGTFETAEKAHIAYCEAAVRLHGDFARFA